MKLLLNGTPLITLTNCENPSINQIRGACSGFQTDELGSALFKTVQFFMSKGKDPDPYL
jgi:hypothetical protein